jgi:hypothetical protein
VTRAEERGQRFHYAARALAADLSPEQQMRWALRYIKERYGGVKRPWLSFTTRERQGMGKRIEMGAPENPYRFGSGAAADEMQLMAGMPARSFGSGPGLLGVDIDRIARHHHELGRREAEGEAEAQLRQARAELADAYDEGYVAGRMERTQGLAGDFRSRLMELHFRLMTIEGGSKSKAHASLKQLRDALDDVMAFADAVRSSDTDAAATLVDDEHTLTRLR